MTNHQSCILEEIEEPIQISKISQAVQNECNCKCHPRCMACVRCNEAYHQLPFPPDMREKL